MCSKCLNSMKTIKKTKKFESVNKLGVHPQSHLQRKFLIVKGISLYLEKILLYLC